MSVGRLIVVLLLFLVPSCADLPPTSIDATVPYDCGQGVAEADSAVEASDPLHASRSVCAARVFTRRTVTYVTARDGTFWGWGANGDGRFQPANEPSYFRPNKELRVRPQLLRGVRDVREVQMEGPCVLAGRLPEGAVYCWGEEAQYTYRTATGERYDWNEWRHPRRMGTVNDVLALFVEGTRSCIRSDYTEWRFHVRDESWAFSTQGRGTTRRNVLPLMSWRTDGAVEVSESRSIFYQPGIFNIPGIVDIAGAYDHVCILLDTGRVRCWGENDFGQCGDFERSETCSGEKLVLPGVREVVTAPCFRTPHEVSGITDAVQIVVDDQKTCARRRDGTVWCWGVDDPLSSGLSTFGTGRPPVDYCGVSRFGNRYHCQRRPVQVVGIVGAVDASYRSAHGCAVLASGEVRCWGVNNTGQLGDGTTEDRALPVSVRW